MKKTALIRILCLLLGICMLLPLAACPAGEPSTGTSATSSATTGAEQGNKPVEDVNVIYGDGTLIDGAGATLPEDCFAMAERNADEAGAIEAESLTKLFRGSGSLTAGATYRLTEASLINAADKIYDGNGAIILAPNGIEIDGARALTFKNMTLIGAVTVKNSELITFEAVEIRNLDGTAFKIEESVTGITLSDCRFAGKTALANATDHFVITDCAIVSEETGILDTSSVGTVVMNCVFTGKGTALSTSAACVQIRGNSFTLDKDAVGISLGGGYNGLVALNVIKGAQTSLKITGATNTSVILNSAVSVTAEDNTSLYLCDNALGGRIRSARNNYFLADGNTYPEDGFNHTALQEGNQNINGDSLTDVEARLDVGADENLLPHTNKELFIGMEYTPTVWVGGTDTGLSAEEYLEKECGKSPYVILAPGLYPIDERVDFEAKHSNTTVYAYGAQIERERTSTAHGGNLGNMLHFTLADKITVKGLTVGFERQSCGQVYVLAKEVQTGGRYILTVVTGAGMDNEFGNTDTSLYNVSQMGAQREGTFYAYCDTGFWNITKKNNGLMEIRVDASVYEMIREGDILTCRSAQGNATVWVYGSTDVVLKDVTLYGASGAFAANESKNRTATTYYRVHNTTKNAPIIDKETYDRYKALEKQYGVSLEVYTDELGRYRGSPAHIGSIDATHTTGCAQGAVAVSCIFENMCDDATNQNHFHARVGGIKDNGNGTATVIYKGNYSQQQYGGYSTGSGTYCEPFIKGDRVYIYTASGRLVCDAPAIYGTIAYIENGVAKTEVNLDRYERTKDKGGTHANCTFAYYEVVVDSSAVNFDAIEGLDLTLNSADNEQKVLIDNMSMASNGFFFDNCAIRNIRSRGLLIKASEGTLQNCTFQNVGMACAALLYEINWGESGVSENITITRNLMDHTGYFIKYTTGNGDRYSPIAIYGLGSRVDEDYLLYKNIAITENVIRNRVTEFAVYVNSARDVIIKDNDFGYHIDGESEETYTRAIHINGAMNIEISGNIYTSFFEAVDERIIAEHCKNIFGADVEEGGVSLIPDKE